jgi:ABC-type uncharacterized transport system involved in gliding motility auxiliary subunit
MKNSRFMNIILTAGILFLAIAGITAAVRGQLDVFFVIPAVSGFLAFAFYITANFQRVKETLAGQSARYGLSAFLYSATVIAVIILLQVILTIHSSTFDVTKAQRQTLSEQTKKVLLNMKHEVDVYYFYSVRARVTQIEDIISMYVKANPRFKFQAIDADRNPQLASKFLVDKYGVVVLSRPDNNSMEKVDTLTESGVTNGLIRITRDSKKKIYFTAGHGEPALDAPKNEKTGYSVLKEELEAYNYEAVPITLFTSGSLPADCSILAIAGLKTDLFAGEIGIIKNYLRAGGRLLVLDAPMVPNNNLGNLLKERGVIAHDDIIIDKMGNMFGGDPLIPIISTYEQHEITASLHTASMMPDTRTFELKGGVTGIRLNSLAKSNPGSWGETDLNSVRKGSVSRGKDDLPAPLDVAGIITQDNGLFETAYVSVTNTTTAVIAFFGSSDFINNTFIGSSGNKEFILNTVNFLAGENDMIAIAPKENSYEPVTLSKIEGNMLFLIPTILLPLLIAAAGFMVFLRRKKS